VADGGGLENRCGSDVTVGSNPTPSALTCSFITSTLLPPEVAVGELHQTFTERARRRPGRRPVSQGGR